MSNDPRNSQQNEVIELSPSQLSPGLAKASEFTVHNNGEATDGVPGHGQRGKTAAEKKKLDNEFSPGFSPKAPIPDRNSL